MMDDDEEHRRYGDSTLLEPIIEQQDDEMTTSPMSSSSMDASFLDEERQAREDIQQFEELEKQFASHRHGIRVKFDDERLPSIAQTTVIKTEPYFQINSTEDQVTKHFYHNEFPSNSKTPSEPDSLEEEYIVTFQEKNIPSKSSKEIYQKIVDQIPISSPGKSILKKAPHKEMIPSSQKKKPPASSSPHSDSNEMLHLAEVTGKQTFSQFLPPLRSLFEPTMNIFDSSASNQSYRPSRLRYYIKPYRGDTYIPPETTKQRSRSLSEQRLAHQSGPTVWHTFSNQYPRPSLYRKQHVSWSPVRDYIHRGREKPPKKPPNQESSSLLSSAYSSSSPCLRTSPSMIPISTHQHPSPAAEEKKEMIFVSPLPDIVHPYRREHNETMQRYDRLLEKMRATDEQLQTLSRSWTNNRQHKTTIETTIDDKQAVSSTILRMCLLILVVFNLLVVYFFNDINILWSRYASHGTMAGHHSGGTSNLS